MEYERLRLSQPYYDPTNVYRIGDTLVDTGHSRPISRNRLLQALNGGIYDGIERVFLTHCHIDHVGGSLSIPELGERPHAVSEGTARVLERYPAYLEEAGREMVEFASGMFSDAAVEGFVHAHNETYFDTGPGAPSGDVNVDRVLADGDSVRLGEYECEVVHTPGHAVGHIALHHRESGVMFSGDVLTPNGHFLYGAIHWDVGEYKRSLRRIRETDPSLVLPGHGDPMDEPRARVDDALTKAERTEQAILDTLEDRGPLGAHELAVEALDASGASIRFLTYVVSAYAIHLAERDLVEVERRPYVFVRPR